MGHDPCVGGGGGRSGGGERSGDGMLEGSVGGESTV